MEAAPKKRSIAGLSQTSSARLMLFGTLLIWQFLEVLAGAPAALVLLMKQGHWLVPAPHRKYPVNRCGLTGYPRKQYQPQYFLRTPL